MRLDFKCLKCQSNEYILKTTLLPEKSPGLKIELGLYYIKICKECGYTELYCAKIIDKKDEKVCQHN